MQQGKYRTSGDETISYLRQQAEENKKLKAKELQAQRDMHGSFQQQQQQMLQAFHKQSEEQHNALLALSQRQQQQNRMLLALVQKLVSK